MESAGDPDVEENPEWAWELFRHYDKLYFRGALVAAPFTLKWTAPRTNTISAFGSCTFGKMSKTITLYRTNRTSADLKNALLHLMIHAIIFLKHGMTCLSSHGPVFRDWMDAINTCTIEDYLRPKGGYCITTTHDFSREKLSSIQGNLWKCKSCSITLVRATRLGPPSDSCCIENVSQDATCGNMLCYWHNHKTTCGGTYVVPGKRGQKMVPKGNQGLLTETSETSKSQEAVQESDSDEVQENSTVAKPYAEGKLPSQVGGRKTRSPGPLRKLKPKQEFVASEKKELFSMVNCNNAKSMGSCSSEKARAIVSSTSPLSNLKRKQTSVASEKHELVSLGSCNNAKSSRREASKKADKSQEPGHVQKSSVQPATSQKKPKLEQDLSVSENYIVFSRGSYKNTKPPGSSTSRKADKRYTPDGLEKSCALVATPQKKLKLEPDLVVLQQNKTNSNKAGKQLNPEDFQKTFVQPAVSQKKLKLEPDLVVWQQNKTNSSVKAGRQLNPEDFQKTYVQLAVSQKKLKLEPDLVALEKHGDAKPLGCSIGNKEDKLHQLEGIQKASVLPAAPPRKLKQDLVASQKNDLSFFVGRSNSNVLDNISSKKAHKQREHEEPRKPIAQPAAPRSILKQQNKTNSSTIARKQHNPEDSRRTSFQPAVSQSKLKHSSRVAPKRQKTRSKTSSCPRKKEYACVSVWANIYESECSSGSTEPLVNKRTERRKRERELSAQILQSRKRSASGISSIKAQPAEEVSSQQTMPPGRCMDIIMPPADLVMTQGHRGPSIPSRCMGIAAVHPADQVMARAPVHQSQPPAACARVVPPHSANPPSLPPSNPSSNPDVIDISDDD